MTRLIRAVAALAAVLLYIDCAGSLLAAEPANDRPFTPGPSWKIQVGQTVAVSRDGAQLMLGSEPVAELKKGTLFKVSEIRGDWIGGVATIDDRKQQGWLRQSELAHLDTQEQGSGKPDRKLLALPEWVVGIAECPVFPDEKLDESTHELSAGTKVSGLAERSGVAHIEMSSGEKGWVRRCHLCSAAEFKRRQAADEVPKNVVCVGANERGSFVYGGSLTIVNGAFTVVPGDAFWMDETMKGKEFSIGANQVLGDPSILVLYKEGDTLARLPVNKAASKTAAGRGARPLPSSGAEVSSEAVRLATIRRAKELKLAPFIMFKDGPDDTVKILEGSKGVFRGGDVGFGNNTLLSNAGATPVDVRGQGWTQRLKQGEFIVIRDGKIEETGMIDLQD